jgi:hypothetical protein
VHTAHLLRAGAHLGEPPEPLEHRHPGRLEQQARARRAGVRRLLEQLDLVAGTRQQHGRRRPAGAAADDADSHGEDAIRG